jgi:hypothetical protein
MDEFYNNFPYYIFIEDGKINGCGQCECIDENTQNIPVTAEVFYDFIEDNLRYAWINNEIVPNPNYERDVQIRHRQELDQLTLTPADVERALYKAKGMDFEDLKALITQSLPQVDIKGLSIEFRAKDFYRGATAGGMRLFDVVGALLGYSTEDMDYLFEHGQLPTQQETPEIEEL